MIFADYSWGSTFRLTCEGSKFPRAETGDDGLKLARFTELARFGDDYVATDAAKVRKFEDGLKLSIRGKIVGHNLQDMDLVVSTALIIEREVDDARSIRDAGASDKKRGSQASSSGSRKKQRTSIP